MADLTPAQKRDLALTDAALLRLSTGNSASLTALGARVTALEAGGGSALFIVDGDDIEGEGGLLIIDLEDI